MPITAPIHPQIPPPTDLLDQVRLALEEDIGSGDLSAQLIPTQQVSSAVLISRESATLCGLPWVEAVFESIDPLVQRKWHHHEGQTIHPNEPVLTLTGASRSILTAERTAINFLQTLSGTATTVSQWVKLLSGTKTELLDTRKTIPGLRTAQKYAVLIGGGKNHRLGLYDQFLIKENHIMASGGIFEAVQRAKQLAPDKTIEVEVENLAEFEEAISAGTHIIMLDNFSLADIERAVSISQKLDKDRPKLEVSGNVSPQNLKRYADTGVDYISAGALTKHLKAIDFSLRFDVSD